MNFKNKVALITGAAVGIGRATAILLAQRGADLVLVDINEGQLESVKKELDAYSTRVLTFVCDVRDEERVCQVMEESVKVFGKIDILVNNAAIWRDHIPFCETTTELWKNYLDVNIMGSVYFTKAVVDGMIERGYGRIINVASVAGVYGNRGMTFYSATKGALISFTKALAKELIPMGITVNAVSPGSVSPASEPDIDYTKPSNLPYIGRTGSDRENAELICFLASDGASYISGENIIIDGSRKSL